MISLRDVVTGFGNRDPLAEVWRRSLRGSGGGSAVITGVPPLRYIGNGRSLTDYLISGNAVQDGKPSPDAPVDAVGCGVRTGNLWSGGNVSIAVGDIYKNTPIDLPNNTYTFKAKYSSTNTGSVTIGFYDENNTIHTYNMTQIDGAVSASYTGIITAIRLYSAAGYNPSKSYSADFADIMLNLGSTALPYEPYGFKLPLTVNGTEYPIYLGQVETTRRVKKLVLTGEETWINNSNNACCVIYINPIGVFREYYPLIICSHVPTAATQVTLYNRYVDYGITFGGTSADRICIRNKDCEPVSGFKAWLASEYANGTPVTVWYVLAEPETAVVNEPLMKIGDYADTVSFAQAVVTIPTVNGENILDVPTEVPPSEIAIKGGIRSV